MRIETGRDGNDFTKNMVTTLAETRFTTVIKQNDKTAIVKGDFDTAIAELDSSS